VIGNAKPKNYADVTVAEQLVDSAVYRYVTESAITRFQCEKGEGYVNGFTDCWLLCV
jgi:hypothetical protein